MTVRVVIVDDQGWCAPDSGWCSDSQPDLEVVGEAGDGAEALRLLDQHRRPTWW